MSLLTIPASVAVEIKRGVSPVDFWSIVYWVVDLPIGPANVDLPGVVVSDLPPGINIIRVVAMLKVRAIENLSATGDNAINGLSYIKVKKSTGAWGVDDIQAIELEDSQWTVASGTRESGDVLIGSLDLKSKVDGNGVYNFRFSSVAVDYDSLRLNDVLVGLRFFFSPAV